MSLIVNKFECLDKKITRRFLLPCQAASFTKPLLDSFFNLNLKCIVVADHEINIKIDCETNGAKLFNSQNPNLPINLYPVKDGKCVIDNVAIIRDDLESGPSKVEIKLSCVLVSSFVNVVGESIVVVVEDSNIQTNGSTQEYEPPKIFSYSHTYGSMLGGDEIILITSQLNQDIVGLQFYEMDKSGVELWVETIRFHQSQLMFKTSLTIQTVPYRGPTTSDSVFVMFRLVACPNPNTLIFSDPHPFYYKRIKILQSVRSKRLSSNVPSADPPKRTRVEANVVKKEGNDLENSQESDESNGVAIEKVDKKLTLMVDQCSQTENLVEFKRKETYTFQEFSHVVSELNRRDQMMNALCLRTFKALLVLARDRDFNPLMKVHRKLLCYVDEDTGSTPIHDCIKYGNLDILKHMVDAARSIQEDAGLDVKNSKMESPLILACLLNEAEIVEYLIEAGACLDSKNMYGQNVFHLAFKQGNSKMLTTVLKYAIIPIKSCDNEVNARPEQKYRGYNALNICDHDGYAPVHYACRNWTSLKMLLDIEEVINWNITTKTRGYAPLHYVAESKNSCAADYCLRLAKMKNIKIDLPTFTGFTPLYLAIMNNNYRSIIHLLNFGADVNLNSQTMGVFNGHDWIPAECEEKWKRALDKIITKIEDLYMNVEKWSREVVGYVEDPKNDNVKLVHYDNILEYAAKDPWVLVFFQFLHFFKPKL